MSYSRRFAFFDKVPLDLEKEERAFQDLPVTCVNSGNGYLWIGDSDGFMHCMDATFVFASFRAHSAGPVRLCRQVPGSDSHLVTVGDSRADGVVAKPPPNAPLAIEERLCVWNTKKWSLTSKSSFPVCCRMVRTAPNPSTKLGEVVCLDVSSSLDTVVLGHSGGAIQLIKGDMTSDRHCRRTVLYDFGGSPVTNLFYIPATPGARLPSRESFLWMAGRRGTDQALSETSSMSPALSRRSSGTTLPPPTSAYLFASSDRKLVSVLLGKKEEPVRTTTLDHFGCRSGCCCLLSDPENPDRKSLAMAYKEAIYFYDIDGRGPCLAVEGVKEAIAVYKNYIASIKHNKLSNCQPGVPDAMSSVSLFEYKNKFIGADFPMPWAHSIIDGFGGLFVLCVEDGCKVKIVELIEKDTQSMLDILFSRKSYNLAIAIAESDNYSEGELAHIHRRYADHLFSQKQYDLAVKEYIKTIGTVDASYVVLRFLENGLISHLTTYLEALHSPENRLRGRPTKHHAALLLNSYVRLDDKERIDSFLDRLEKHPGVGPEFRPCVNVLRRAGYPRQALRLAQMTGNQVDCMRIQAEDLRDPTAVLQTIKDLKFDQALEAVCKHGAFLMQKAPSETAELLDRLCAHPMSGCISAQHFIKIFVNNRLGLMKFLERYIQKSNHNHACLANMVETLLELLLHEALIVAADESRQDRGEQVSHLHNLAMCLLADPKMHYDEGKALIICKQRDFFPGCLYIWMKNKQYDQIMEHYILQDNFSAILKACEDYGNEVPSLWFEALKYVADKPQLGDQLPRILKEIELRNLVSPLVVLKFLTSPEIEKCHTLGSVKNYLLHYLESGRQRAEANQAEMQRLRAETLRNREIARNSKTKVKIFQQQKCAVCNQSLEPPSIHFLCDHSYHKSCFDTYASDDRLCPECAPLIRRGLVEQERPSHVDYPALTSSELLEELELALSPRDTGISSVLGRAVSSSAAEAPHVNPSVIARGESPHQPPPYPTGDIVTPRPMPKVPNVPPDPFDEVADSGRGQSSPLTSRASVPTAGLRPSASANAVTESGVVLSSTTVSNAGPRREAVPRNPFGEGEKGKESAYPDHLNPF